MPSRTTLLLSTVGALAGAALLSHAGPLNPPAGPVASSYKTLSEVEPRTAINSTNTPGTSTATFRITQPGSYYLTAGLTGVAGQAGIEIAASDVSLDLCGFRLQGVAGSLAGIAITGSQSGITIRNGTVRGFAGGGIVGSSASACTLEDLRCLGNTGNGIQVFTESAIRRCDCSSNTGNGILASIPAIVESCIARNNGQTGITAGDHSNIANCIAVGNTGTGLSLGPGVILHSTVAAQNSVGVSAGSGLNAVDCIARNNASHGFFVFGASFTSCLATANGGDGFNTDSAVLANCRSTSNTGNGFNLGSNSFLVHSTAISNNLFGAHLNSGYVLRNSFAQNSLNQSELREVKFDTRGRADGNHLNSFNSSEWGLGGPSGALFILNSQNGGFVTTFGGTEGPDIDATSITTSNSPHGNYDLP